MDRLHDAARAVMVLGTTSGAGKSWLSTALCRWYARRGLKVAPFKAQNMSNNARVVRLEAGDGVGEIGSAQYFQALAAGVSPDVRMNPVLLKPESEHTSQVVVMGRVRSDLRSVPWRERAALLWPVARQALHHLCREFDVIVIEGAGSPAEINLHSCDYVNMRTALEVNAACLLVADIDRGGAFAHLLGTYLLLQGNERPLIRGFVLNRFRGDQSLLHPGPEALRRLTGIPTIAVLPMWREHGLPEEDGVEEHGSRSPLSGAIKVGVIGYPQASNLDEFQPLRNRHDVHVVWVRSSHQFGSLDLVILPGSKHVASDLLWMRGTGIDVALRNRMNDRGPILGVCGGMQMLGMFLHDPGGVDGAGHGLGILPIDTTFASEKLLRRTEACFNTLAAPWDALSNRTFSGYEIRHGRSRVAAAGDESRPALATLDGDPIGWQSGSVLGIAVHGLFECASTLAALFRVANRPLEDVFDGLADFIDRHVDEATLVGLLNSR